MALCSGDTIIPDKTNPIQLLWNNVGFTTPYIFSFWIPTDINSDAMVTIQFPAQFTSNLGISACISYRITDEYSVFIPCSVSLNKLSLQISVIKAGAHRFKIKGIINPTSSGSTGLFIIRTMMSGTIIDENSLFPSIGIAPVPDSLTVSTSVEGALLANFSPLYKFTIVTSSYYPQHSWMRMIFPSGYSFNNLLCYVQEWNTWVALVYDSDISQVIFSAFNLGILPIPLTFDIYGIYNPSVSGNPGNIIVEILRENTYTVLARTSSVTAPLISPGTISKVQITGSPLMTNSPGTYTFVFLPFNVIPQGGSISIVFPLGYNGLISSTCLAIQGLQPITGTNQVTCTETTTTVTFANFQSVSAQYITVTVQANNPSVPGNTGNFAIYTHNQNSLGIDQNLNAGHVTISEVQYPEGFTVLMLYPKTDNPIGSYGPLDIFLHSRNYVPCVVPPSTYLYITIDCPPVIVAGAGYISCTFGEDKIVASLCNYDTSGPLPQIQIKTPMTGIDCCPLAIKITTAGVPSGFSIPIADYGQYKFIAKVYNTNNIQIEEAEYIFGTNPATFSTMNFWYLHNNRASWNVLKFDFTLGVDIPANGMIEWEFITRNNSFPRDLGWGLQSFQTQEFSCTYDSSFPDAIPSSIYCEITAGTTFDSVFVRMKGFNSVVTAGVNHWIHLSNVQNADYVGFVPYLIMRTKDSSGVVLNKFSFSIPALIALPTPSVGSVVGSSYIIDHPNTEMAISLTMSATLAGVAEVYVVFPHGYKWNHPNAQGVPINKCAVKALQGPISYYEVFTQPQAAGILYTQTASDSVSSPFKTCFTADHQSLWVQNPTIYAYTIVNQQVRDYYIISHGNVNFTPNIVFNGALQSYTAFDLNTTNLWRLVFTQSHRITVGGTIEVLLPTTYFVSVNQGCYKIVNAGITCYGENFYTPSFHRMSLLGVTHHLAVVNLPANYQLNPPNTFEVWFYATTGFTPGSAVVQIFSEDEDNDIIKRIDQLLITIPIANHLYPYYVSMDWLETNYIEAYGSEPWNSFEEWGPIKIQVTPNQIFPETNTLYNTFITITFPCVNGVQYYTKNPSGLIQCRMNTLLDFRQEGYFGRLCTFIQGTPGSVGVPCIPDQVTFYTPTELRVDPTLGAPFDVYEIVLTTIGVTNPLQNGFLFPSVSNYYRFIVNMNKNEGANIEQAEPFMYIMEDRFTYLYTTSEHKLNNDRNIMMFNFELTLNMPASNDPLTPGYIFLEFPFDYQGTGAGWLSDLGTGIPDGGAIDCLQDFTVHTAPAINPDPVTGENRVTCILKYGYFDYTTIVVSNIANPNIGSNFNLYFGGILNPSKNLYDFPIRIRTVYEDLTDILNPNWVTIEKKLNTYIETTFTVGGGNGQVTTHIQDDYSTIINPVRFIPGEDTLTVSFNIENNAQSSPGDWIWVQVPPGFQLPDWKNVSISLKVTNGTQGGLLDSTHTCIPTTVFTWPKTNLFKFLNCMPLTVKQYHYPVPPLIPPQPPDSPNRVAFYPIMMNTWPADPITFHSWIVNDRISSISRVNIFPTDYLTTATTCIINYCGTLAYGDYGVVEIYNFQFTCPSTIPATGEYIIYFPLEFSSAIIDPTTCVFGATSGVTLAIGAVCSIVRGIEFHISGFTAAIPINTYVDVNITVQNPSQGALPNPHIASRYVIATYNSTSLTKGSFQVLDRTDPAGTAWLTLPTSRCINPPTITTPDNSIVFYHESFPLSNPGIGPITFSISSPIAIAQKIGYIVLNTYESISLPNNGQIRCSWQLGTLEYLADDCIFSASLSSSLPSTITMYAPTSSSIPFNTLYTIYITTASADQGKQGISFNSGLVKYGFLVQIFANGGTTITSAGKGYLEQVGSRFPMTSIIADQWTENAYTRIRISLQVGVTSIPSTTSRIVVEFPTSPAGLFAADLGLGITNNGNVPCQGSGSMTVAISCYLFLGTPSESIPATVIIKGYSAITSGSTYTIEFPKIFNPAIGGDNIQISLVVYALDLTSGWPGTFLYYREVENIYRIMTNAPTIANAATSATADASNDFTFTLSPIAPIAGDYIVVELHSAASLASSSLVCKDASLTVLVCTYYSSSNTVIMTILNPTTTITIFSMINPLPSASYLDFYLEHWTLNYLSYRLHYLSTAKLPITVTYPDKPSLFANDMLEYQIDFMPTAIVPVGGSVLITFPIEFPSLPETSCYNYYAGFVSFMSGPYTCVVAGLTAKITGFNQMATGIHIVIRVLAQNPSSGLTTTTGITVSTHSTTAGTGVDLLETNTDTNTFTVSNTAAPTYYNVPRQFLASQFIVTGQYAPIKIKVSGFGNLVKDAGNLMITLNGFGTIPTGSEIVCLWASKRSRCSMSGNIVTVYAPEDSNWSTYPVVITITTTNADSIDTVGIKHPSTAGEYRIEVDGDTTGDLIYEHAGIDYIQVFPSTYFASFKVIPSHSTANAFNLFEINIKTTTLIPNYGYIRVYFPTQDNWGNTLFSNDLGTGLVDGQIIPCQAYPGSAGLTGLNVLSCKLYHGNNDVSKPAFVELTNFQAIPAGTSISFVIWKIKNPPNTIPDAINIEMFAISLDDAYTQLDYFYSNYVMTITAPIASDPGTPSSPYNTPTVTAGTVGTVLTISVHLMDNNAAIVAGTIYILEVSSQISLVGITIAGCTVFQTLNLIQYNSPPSGAAGSYPILSFTTAAAQNYQWSSPVIHCYQWSNSFSQRDGDAYIGISALTLATFSSVIPTFPAIFNQYSSSSVSFTLTVAIPQDGTIQITYPGDFTLLSTDCELSGLVVSTNFKCSISGSVATLEVYESIPSTTTLIVTTDLLALSDTSAVVTVNSFYDSLSTVAIETGTGTPTTTVATPYWPNLLDYPPQSLLMSTAIISSNAKISFKVNPGITISNSATSYLQVTMGTAFSGKISNGVIYCTISNNKVPCYESIANQQFTIYASSLLPIASGTWQEVIIYTQYADGDNNGYIQPASAQSNTITVIATDGTTTQTETRNMNIPNNLLPLLTISYLHTTASQLNVYSFLFKTLALTIGTTDKLVIEFPLKDYNNNLLFNYDLGSGKASGENFFIDNYSLTGSFSCILYHGDSTNNYPARIEITGYNSISAGTSISFDLAKIKNPQTSGYNINVSIRVYINSNGVITEERTVDYLFSPFSYTPSVACAPTQPIFSTYVTSSTSTLAFTCCSSVDLIATDILILEIPTNYPFPSTTAIQAGSSFATLYKIFPSAKWIALKSTTTVACHSSSPLSILTNFINPSIEILSNTLTFKAYIITTKTPVNGITLYEPTLIDIYTYSLVSTSILPTATTITPTISLSNSDTIEKIQSILTTTISYTGTIPTTGYFQITLNVASDPYYFYVVSGITGKFSYSLSGMVYTVTGFTSIASSIIINIPTTNPSSGSSISVIFSAYDTYNNLLGTATATTGASTSSGYLTLPLQSHIYRYLSYDGSTDYATFSLSLNLPFAVSASTNYLTIEFDSVISTSTFTASTSDSLALFDGVFCSSSPCYSATWTSKYILLYNLDSSGTITSGVHYVNFAGYPNLNLNSNSPGLHIIKIWFSGTSTPGAGSYYYTFYWFSPSSAATSSSINQYGQGISDISVLEMTITASSSMDFVLFEFFSQFTIGLGYPSALGTGLTDSNYISGTAENSGTYIEDCVLRVSTTALLSGILCSTTGFSSASSYNFYLAGLINPSSATTAYYQIYAFTYTTSSTNINSFIQGSFTISASSNNPITAIPFLSTTIVQDSSTWTFSPMVDSTNLISGNKVLISFTNNQNAYQIASAVSASGITSFIPFKLAPALWITLSLLTPSITMNNPIYSSSYIVKASSYSVYTLTQVATCASLVIATGTISTITGITPQPPTAALTIAIDLDFTLPHTIPSGGIITIGFSTAFYSSISCTDCTSSLSNIDYKTIVTYAISTNAGYNLITISNFQAASGASYLNQIQVTCAVGGSSIIEINTYSSSSYLGIDQGTYSITVNSASAALPGIVLLPRLSLINGPQIPTISSVADLSLLFNPYTTINPTSGGNLVLRFASNTDWIQSDTTSKYVCLINGYLSTSCSRSTTDLSIYPSITITSGTLYKISVASNNGINDGLIMPTTIGYHQIILKSYIGVPIQDQGFIDIPITSTFSKLSSVLYVQGSGNPSLLQINITPATAVSVANSGAFIVEFPVYDLQMAQAQFIPSIGSSEVDGTYFPCELFTTGSLYVPTIGVTCLLNEGYSSTTRTRSTTITVTFPTSLTSGSSYILGFPGITVPSTSRGSDIIIYTRELSAGIEVLKDYQVLRHVYYAHSVNTYTSLSLGFPTISNSKLMSTGNTYTFSFQPSIPIQTSDILVFTLNPGQITMTTSTTTSIGCNFMYLYISAGWIVIQPSSIISTAAPTSIGLTNLENPLYISSIQSDYIINLMHWNGLTNNINEGIWKYYYSFDLSIPSPAYTLGILSITSVGCLTCGGTIESSHYLMFYTVFSYDLDLPSTGAIQIQFPVLANEFQSFAYNCESYSNGFAQNAKCQLTGFGIVNIYGFGGYTKSNTISLYGRSITPPIGGLTSAASINIYYDMSIGSIGIQSTLSFNIPIVGPASVPTSTVLADFSSSSPLISSRTGSTSSFIFSINPTTTISKNTGTVSIKLSFTQAAGTLLCKFIDTTNNYRGYISSACTVVGTTYTITAPINTDITSGKIWNIQLYTYGLSNNNGFLFPAAGSNLITVTAGTTLFDYYYIVLPAASLIAKADSYCNTVIFSNLFKITLQSNIIANNAGGIIEIGFSPIYFTNTLGTGTTDDQQIDCTTTINAISSIYCTLQQGISTSFDYRPVLSRVRLHNQNADASKKLIMIPNIINPSSTNININIQIRVFTLIGSVETDISNELIFYVLGTTASTASSSNANSFLNSEDNISLGFSTATFQVSTDLLTYTLTSTDHIFWRFPYILAGGSTVIKEDSSQDAQLLDIYLQYSINSVGLIVASPPSPDSYTSAIQWDFSNFENPPFVPPTFPVLVADIVSNGFHVETITFNQILINHTPGTVAVSQFYISGNSISPNEGYLGAYVFLDITFSTPNTMGTNLVISIDFPTSFAPDPYCQVAGTTISPIVGDWIDCVAASTSFVLTNINGYSANSVIEVTGWVNLPTTVGPHSIGINYYYTYPTLVSYLTTYSITLQSTVAHTNFKMGRFIYLASDIPVYGGKISMVYFTLSIPSVITMNLGYVDFIFEASSFTAPSTVLTCEWSLGVNIWQASSCIPTVTAGILTIKVIAPQYNAINIGTWIIRIRGLQGTIYDGLTFPTGTYKRYTIATKYSHDGVVAPVFLSTVLVKVPQEPFASANIFTYNTIMNSPIILQMSFTTLTSLSSGVPQIGGKTYMLIYFPTVVNSVNCFADDFGSGISNLLQLNSFNMNNMNNLETILIYGDPSTGVPGVIYVLNYANPLSSSSSFEFYIPWLYNPVLANVIINFTVEIWEEISNIYQIVVYQEFKYCYDSRNQPITTHTSVITYINNAAHQTGEVGFQFILTNTITGTDPEEKVVWTLAETSPIWTSNYCTTFTCDPQLSYHRLILAPNFKILNHDTLNLFNVLNPDNPNYSQTWSVYVFKGSIIQDLIIFNAQLPFSIPPPTLNDYATVTWRLPDDNVPNPLINRYDHYLFRFRPSTSIPVGGKVIINFPGLSTAPATTYIAANACNPLHGILGPGIKCASTSNTQIACTGFKEYDPWMPEIQIECFATNPSSPGTTANFQITTYDASGNIQFNSPTVGSFVINYAPTQLAFFTMSWPERTRAPACENRNYADIYVKIVTVRGIYGMGDTLRIFLPTGVSLATDVNGVLYLECTWQNRYNKTPAEFCNYVPSAPQNYVDVGITDQQGLVPYGQYTVHVYSRDAAGGLYQSSFILPSFPEWESWYILATNGGAGDGAKLINEVCPVPWTSVSLIPYSYSTSKWTIMDLVFTPSRDIPVGGGVVIEFPTTNELDLIFAFDLGLSMDPLVLSKPVGCYVLTGFGSPSPGVIQCTAYKSFVVSKWSPAHIYITGHTVPISSLSSHSIRIVKFQNPIQPFSPILHEQLRVHFTIWSFCATSNYFETDYARYNIETILNIFDFTGPDILLLPTPTIYTNEILSNPILTIFTIYTLPLHTSIHLGSVINSASSFVMYEFDPAFTLPTTGSPDITCNGATANCIIYAESMWIVWQDNSAANTNYIMNFLDSGSNQFKSPNYEKPYYLMSAYVITNGIWAEEHSFQNIPQVNSVPPTVVITHRLTTFHRKTYDIYTITITPSKGSTRVVRIDIIFPPEFMWIDSICTVTGLGQTPLNIFPVSCLSDCNNQICTNHIIITNFDPLTAVGIISVVTGAMNPATALTTSKFYVYYYSSLTDTTQIVENWSGNPLTYDSILYPYDYWVEWPTVSIYERQVQEGTYGQIWFRFRPRVPLSSTTGSYQIILPDEFDIAPSATPECILYHTDIPFANYPDRWTQNSTHLIVSECLYSNKVINVIFTGDILREFYGIKTGICTYLVLTTEASPIDGTQGYRSSLTAGCYDIQFYAMEGSNVLESAISNICVLSQTSSNMQVYSSTIDVNTNTIIRVEFTSSSYIPNGYFYMDGTYPGPQSSIIIEFESYQSFAPDLAGQYLTNMQVFCNGIQGITPIAGGGLSCTLTIGIVNLPPPALEHIPAIITVTNFNEIAAGTFVSIHLPIIRNPSTINNTPQITVGVYKTDYTGTVTWIEYRKLFELSPVIASLNPAQQPVCTTPSVFCSISNLNIRSRTNLMIYFKASAVLNSGSMIVITFPVQYTAIPTSGISATIKKNPFGSKLTDTYIISGITVVSYPEARMIALTISGTINSGEDIAITLLNFTNPSYIDTTGYISYYSINAASQVQDSFITGNIFTVFTLQPLKFATNPVFTSNNYALGSAVSMILNFSLAIDLEQGSSLTLTMPISYPNISTINPSVACSLNIVSTCTVFEGEIIISNYQDISANSDIIISIFSLLNPTVAIMIPQTPQGLSIKAYDSLGRAIAYSIFPSYRIVEPNPVLRLEAIIESSYYESSVPSTYNFNINTMQGIQNGGSIVIIFPVEYPSLPPNERCFTGGALQTINFYSINGNTLTVNINQQIGRFEQFNITIGSVKNPSFAITSKTSAFSIATYYAGNALDTLDTTDSQAFLIINPAPLALTIVSSNFNPRNEGEVSLYSIVIENPSNILIADDISFIVQFPIDYSYELIPANINLYCSSIPSFSSCYILSPRNIVFRKLSPSAATITMTFNIYGISNPVIGTTHNFNLMVYNNTNNSVIAYDNNVDFQTLSLPGLLNMSAIECSSEITESIANYLFTFTLDTTGIIQNGGIYIDWPGDYFYLFTTQYQCQFINSTDPRLLSPSCTFLTQSGNSTSIIALTQEITPIGQELFLQYLNMPTLQENGNSGNFIIRIFGNDLQAISVRSYPNLTPYPNLNFNDIGYRIFINTTQINVYQGSYSETIMLTLEKPTYYILEIQPIPENSNIGIIPSIMIWQYAWTLQNNFQIYVPNTVSPGMYLLSWIKTENSSDPSTRIFKPLSNIYINVMASTNQMGIICDDISYIPLDGSSLPVTISLPLPTYENISIELSTISPVQDNYVYITPNVLNFTNGQSQQSFSLYITTGAVSGYISLALSGSASNNFYLVRDSIPFQTLPVDSNPPSIYSIRPTLIGRTYIEVAIQTSEPVKIYYIITREGTGLPTVQMLINGDTMWCDTEIYFSSTWSDFSNTFTTISFTGLTDTTDYVMYIALVDQSQRTSEKVYTFSFTTLPTYLPARFRVYVTTISSITEIIQGVAIALALPTNLFINTGIDPALGISNGLYYEITLFINRTIESNKPIDYINNADYSLERLILYIPYFDNTTTLSQYATEYSEIQATFNPGYNAISSSNGTVYVSASISTDGAIFGVILGQDKLNPNSLQIKNGLDSHNRKIKNERCASSTVVQGQVITLLFTNLPLHQNFIIYLAGENNMPGNPALMSDENVISIDIVIYDSLDTSFNFTFVYLNLATTIIMTSLSLFLI